MNIDKIKCEICDNSTKEYGIVNEYNHYYCDFCGHVFVHPKPNQIVLDEYYADKDFYNGAKLQQDRLKIDAINRLKKIKNLCKKYDLGNSLLDVGCASGIFLQEAVKMGINPVGSERSEALAMEASRRSGVDVRVEIIENRKNFDKFSTVTAWEVIEHSISPRVFLKSLVDTTEKNGLIAISTPLMNGIPSKYLGLKFPMIMPPEHLSLFTKKSIKILADEFNLEVVHYSSFSNINIKAIVSGVSRKFFNKEADDIGYLLLAFIYTCSGLTSWIPYLVDKLGYGSEMLIIFRKHKQE